MDVIRPLVKGQRLIIIATSLSGVFGFKVEELVGLNGEHAEAALSPTPEKRDRALQVGLAVDASAL